MESFLGRPRVWKAPFKAPIEGQGENSSLAVLQPAPAVRHRPTPVPLWAGFFIYKTKRVRPSYLSLSVT